ncbi:hypothetical protein [Rhodopirellula bahusiensis]|uniref:Uncharacterized protein n=1 Tax=Rhodopirellula bahusiensis TaxID=2014065 RepID=A0A2G1WAP9_9BACT|nr:hypothetical protein [Rhodopirellula bahusiensis]PHQ36108.1 hypothetical protein CEE69_05330 [Rhodopirellula bahusiensis]
MTPKKLYCEKLLVGDLFDTQYSDVTWFGSIKLLAVTDDPTHRRILEYILFCEDWNDRTAADPMDGPDADEFDAFNDIIKANWFIEIDSQERHPIHLAPVFSRGNELSWRPLNEQA